MVSAVFLVVKQHVEPNCVIGIINPWTSNASWDNLHSQAGIHYFQQILLIYANYVNMKVLYNIVVVCAVLVFEVCGVILFILAFLVPVGWPMLVALLVLWLGP